MGGYQVQFELQKNSEFWNKGKKLGIMKKLRKKRNPSILKCPFFKTEKEKNSRYENHYQNNRSYGKHAKIRVFLNTFFTVKYNYHSLSNYFSVIKYFIT